MKKNLDLKDFLTYEGNELKEKIFYYNKTNLKKYFSDHYNCIQYNTYSEILALENDKFILFDQNKSSVTSARHSRLFEHIKYQKNKPFIPIKIRNLERLLYKEKISIKEFLEKAQFLEKIENCQNQIIYFFKINYFYVTSIIHQFSHIEFKRSSILKNENFIYLYKEEEIFNKLKNPNNFILYNLLFFKSQNHKHAKNTIFEIAYNYYDFYNHKNTEKVIFEIKNEKIYLKNNSQYFKNKIIIPADQYNLEIIHNTYWLAGNTYKD